MTGRTLGERWQEAGEGAPETLAQLLHPYTDDVRAAATELLMARLEDLAAVGVVDGDDLAALDPPSLIGDLLAERRPRREPGRDSIPIVTTILHPPGARHVRFSMRIQG